MNTTLRFALVALNVVMGLAVLVKTGPSARGQAPPPDKKGKFVTAEATELKDAQNQEKKTADEEKLALEQLRAREAALKEAAKRPLRSSAEEETRTRLKEDLQAAKVAITVKTLAHTEAKKHLAEVQGRIPGTQEQTSQPRVSEPAVIRQSPHRFDHGNGGNSVKAD